VFGVLGAIALFAPDALAQSSTTGAIQGVVKDKANGEPLAGVTVVATSPNAQGSHAEITDGKGAYKIDSLPPGIYLVTFYFSDVQVQRPNIQVQLSRAVRVDQKIDLGDTSGEVIVIDEKAPTIDISRTDEGIAIDKDYLRHIPVPGRTFGSALGAAAGAQTDSRGTGFSGSTSLENSYVIDGINTSSLSTGTIGTPLINEFIEEIQIITGGYQAEFGRATGAVINVITKSGTNEFHGSVFSTITPYVRDRDPILPVNTSIHSDTNQDYLADFGVELGGPIVKDKVWFYVGFAPRLLKNTVTRYVKSFRDCQAEMEDGSLTPCDPMYADGVEDVDPATGGPIFDEIERTKFALHQQQYQFVTKVNYALAPEHQGSLSILGSPTTGDGMFGVTGTPTATRADFNSLTTDIAAKWTSKFNDNKTQVEAVFGWHRDKYDQDATDNSLNDIPTIRVFLSDLSTFGRAGAESNQVIEGCKDATADDPYPTIPNCPVFQYYLDSPGFIIDNLEDRKSGQVKVTQRADLAGHHEFKAGVDIENNVEEDVRSFNDGVYYQVIPHNAFLQTRVHRFVNALNPESGQDICGFETVDGARDLESPRRCDYLRDSPVHGQTINWSAFAQDSWSIQPNLVLNYGIRYEEQRMRYAEHIRGTVDPFTDEPLGTNALRLRNMWAPRLGATYDWTKEGRSKLFGSVGRYYESIPMTINDFSFSGDTQYSAYWSFGQCTGSNATWEKDPSVEVPHPKNCPDAVSMDAVPSQDLYRGGITLVTPGTKAQYLDEAILGVQYEVLEDLRLGVTGKRRSLGRVLEDVSIDRAETYIIGNPGPDGFDEGVEREMEQEIARLQMEDPDSPELARLETRLEQFRGVRTFDKPRRDYTAVELTALKRFSRNFYVQSGYTLSTTRGNYPGLVNEDDLTGQPNISTQYDLAELMPNRDGPLPNDRTHFFRLDSYYTWDFEKYGVTTAGLRFRAFSGTPIDVLGAHYVYGFDQSYLLPRGSFGRTEFVTGTDFHLAYGRILAQGYQLDVFMNIFNLFNQEQTFIVDEAYTFDNANPIVGGEYEDLVYLKAADLFSGVQTPHPVRRQAQFNQTRDRYTSQSIQFGARLTF
jgi:hypothetical protein